MKKAKISIIGSGNVGSQAAYLAAVKGLGDIVLIDVKDGIAKGKALDLFQATPLLHSSVNIIGGSNYDLTKDSNVVIVTAGRPRSPGMSRDDLIQVNAAIMKDIIENVVKYAPHCVLIIVTNPLDEMVYLAKKLSKFPKERIIGMAGVLDTTRFKTFIAQELKVSVENVSAIVLGGHGDSMVPLPRLTSVGSIPLSELLSSQKINALIKRTQNGGAEIVELMGTSAFYAPGAAIIEMVESILKDQKRILPCSAELRGEYGQHNVFVGVPCVLGIRGVEKIIQIKLNSLEKKLFMKTVAHVKSLHKIVDKFVS